MTNAGITTIVIAARLIIAGANSTNVQEWLSVDNTEKLPYNLLAPDICGNCLTDYGSIIDGRVRLTCPSCQTDAETFAPSTALQLVEQTGVALNQGMISSYTRRSVIFALSTALRIHKHYEYAE